MGEEKKTEEQSEIVQKELVEVQERTFRIYKKFIRCANCVRNIDVEKMHHGIYEKSYCNQFKQKLQNQYDVNYDIDADRKKAQHCIYYLPEIGTLADLTYLKPFEIVNDMIELDKQHADNLKSIFAYPNK